MQFSTALDQLQQGNAVTRASWTPGTFVFMQVPSTVPSEIVPKMTSLPPQIKAIFAERIEFGLTSIHYEDQLAIDGQGYNVRGYNPSVSDVLALDWEVYNG